MTRYRSFSDYCDDKRSRMADFDPSDLAPQFVPAFERGDTYRVKVDFGYGEKPVWGFVGVTSGWKPSFILMRRRGQHGSSEILSASHLILSTKTIR